MWDIYIVQVVPADGWGAAYFYCFHNLANARAKLAAIAKDYDMDLIDSDFAMGRGEYDRYRHIKEINLSAECFED